MRLVGAVAVAFLTLAAAAFAATGDLVFKSCVDDNDTGTSETCAAETDGLDSPDEVAVSPDGSSVYAISNGDAAVVRFARKASGALVPKDCIDDNDLELDACADSTDGLGGPTGIAISPDGTSVYVTSTFDDAVVHFKRNTSNGSLKPQGCVEDDDPPSGPDDCAQQTDGLNDAEDIVVSPDGLSAYAVSGLDEAIVRFDRDPATGTLTPRKCIGQTTDECDTTTPGLGPVHGVAISADGDDVYAAVTDGRLQRFSRKASGALEAEACVEDIHNVSVGCVATTDGLAAAEALAISPDGRSIYIGSATDNSIVHVRRAAGGGLTPKACTTDEDLGTGGCTKTAEGLEAVSSVAVSPGGDSVYAVGIIDHAVVIFDRNTSSGAISAPRCVEDNDAGPDECTATADGLSGPEDVALSPDGTSAYVASFFDNAITRFNRKAGL